MSIKFLKYSFEAERVFHIVGVDRKTERACIVISGAMLRTHLGVRMFGVIKKDSVTKRDAKIGESEFCSFVKGYGGSRLYGVCSNKLADHIASAYPGWKKGNRVDDVEIGHALTVVEKNL